MSTETWFDRFPVEILFQVFNYLSTIDIINAFFDLNERLNNILVENKDCFTSLELPTTDLDRWETILPIIAPRVHCLKITTNDFSIPWHYFPNLKSIVIASDYNLSNEQLESFFQNKQFRHFDSFQIKESKTFFDRSIEKTLTDEYLPLRNVLNENSSLKIFQCSLTTRSIVMFQKKHFQTNSNLYALTLTLEHCQDIFTLIQYTPNLKYLNVTSNGPRYNEDLTTKINVKLQQLYLTFKSAHWTRGDSLLTQCIEQLSSSSLRCFSLNLIHAGSVSGDELPFNSIRLQTLLQSMTELKQFHVYARLYDSRWNDQEILSRFRSQFWLEQKWSFGMHGAYFYTLPFPFDVLRDFDCDFQHVKSNKPEILIDNPQIWYNVKSIQLSATSHYYDKNFVQELKVKMPKLNFIELVGYQFSDVGPFENWYPPESTCQIHDIDVTLDSVTTIQFHHEYLQNQEPWLINVTPNLTHLILSNEELPPVEGQLGEVLKKKLRRLDIDQFSFFTQLRDTSYVCFSNVHEMYLYVDLSHGCQEGPFGIIKTLMNFRNLKKLTICFHPNTTSYKSLRNKVVQCLDTDEIRENYQVKHFEGYSLFLKKSLS